MSPALQRSGKLLVLTTFVMAAAMLAGCGLLGGSKTQTITDPGNSYHFTVPESWVATVSPGIITLYGGKDMPEPDAAIDKEPWYFVLSSSSLETDLPDALPVLAKARAESRKWKNLKMGKPVKTTLGKALAYEMDVAATDDLGRAFEGKLLLARRGGTDVLLFGFTKPGEFEGARYEEIKEDFFWLVGSDQEMEATKTAEPAKKDDKKTEKK